MNHSPTNREEPAAPPVPESPHKKSARTRDWIALSILAIAALFRFLWIELKPPHHDEGVVAFMAEGISTTGYYAYDPTNYHGPLPFYLSWLSQRFFGRSVFAMRFPVVMMSMLAVGVMLGFREFFKDRAARWAALATATSATMVYFGRQCAHETGAMLFNMLMVWGAVAICRGGTVRDLWAAGLGLAGMILCKETYAIHVFAIALAIPALFILCKISPAHPMRRTPGTWTWRDLFHVVCGCAALILFFYSGTFQNWKGVEGLWTTWSSWVGRGVAEDVQGKPITYYFEMLVRYDWTMLLGLIAALAALLPGTRRETRFLALIALAGTCGYNLVQYKTPWLTMSWGWPLHLLFGIGVVASERYIGRKLATFCAGTVLLLMAAKSWSLNFHNYAPPGDVSPYPEPYAYVQALDDINKVTTPLNALAALDSKYRNVSGAVVCGEQFPLPWLLGDFKRIGWYGLDADGNLATPQDWNLDFILAPAAMAHEVETHLTDAYFRDDFQIRNMGGERSVIYFRASLFAPAFPDRTPQFLPTLPGDSAR